MTKFDNDLYDDWSENQGLRVTTLGRPAAPRQVLVFKPSNVLKSKINKSMVRTGK